MSTDTRSVDVREVVLRDGLQLEAPIPLEAKLAILDAVSRTGVCRVEVTSFVSPSAVPALADAEQVAAALHRWPGLRFSALVAGHGGARRAVAAGIPDLEYVISASDGHSLANAARTTDEAVAATRDIAALAHGAGGICEAIVAVAWDCPFDGRTPVARTVDVARRAVDLGADRLCLGDTIGTLVPARLVEVVEAVRDACPGTDVGVHLHDTRGAGIACVLAAVQIGVTSLDASTGGLGGCPFAPGASGNIATEEVVHLLEGSGFTTGLDLTRVLQAAAVVEEAVGHALPSRLHRAGGPSRPRPRPVAQGSRSS
ncbi:hydroxymethylglutaryl-CoA lyase [Pseudonocardia sp. KRD-184]|uniref:Hydroxymethylglutaryl-CoA lyase n=1 Tax=Pseudonocardia oceani TaxID=2792013 RepID=A0ABS6U3U5_9PSEU|nr:hydroxymethylglutaryl-CoA lyase [Pseudonocardia oceani]MBW0091623.1 hydroxymethylglutaryl-CoA lyase [Pseudonocardia oceani]MBW0099313.1 hydroxymethylglutaryl-CoA lyase [Pseudonocardia oceani]MBW0125439.1 hydroxymethylglutaryl-CoA lyase [Pseudonocardia oceani]MBW0126915.1 hydroxymethylglutaryl-CoA lyase [Pseudonocardia oceani]